MIWRQRLWQVVLVLTMVPGGTLPALAEEVAPLDPGAALIAAARSGDATGVQAALAAGASPDIQDASGYSALMWASWRGHIENVRALIAAGANINFQGAFGFTALMRACERGHVELAQLLLGAGADPDLQNERGETALMEAAALYCRTDSGRAGGLGNQLTQEELEPRLELIQALLDAGADVSLRDEAGETVLTQVRRHRYREVEKLLMVAGAQEAGELDEEE